MTAGGLQPRLLESPTAALHSVAPLALSAMRFCAALPLTAKYMFPALSAAAPWPVHPVGATFFHSNAPVASDHA